MLKITIQRHERSTVFELEGSLTGPWVDELKGSWRMVAARPDRAVRIVLKCVTFIDECGKNLLSEMHRCGAELVAEGCMVRAIIQEIAGTRGKTGEQERRIK